MAAGLLAALGAGLLWGLVFVVPLILHDYPGVVLAFGRYTAFGLLAIGLAWFDRAALARLSRADWLEAARLALVGNLLYYTTLASAIQLAGAPLPTLFIGTLPVVIAVTSNLIADDNGAPRMPWRHLALPLLLILGGLALVHRPDALHKASNTPLSGIALAIAAVACWTWYPIRNSRWLRRHGAGQARAWATAQGLMTLPLALLAMLAYAAWDTLTGSGFLWPAGPRPAVFVSLMLVVGLVASWLGTMLWNRASHLLPPALAGQLIVFETMAALTYAFIWYHRWPTVSEGGGILLLVCGVALGIRAFRRSPGNLQAAP